MRILLAILVAVLVLVVILPFILNMAGFSVPQLAFVGGAAGGNAAGSGIWRSTDSGNSWKELKFQAGGEPLVLSVRDYFFHPFSASVIYMATNGNGLWRSENSGASWKRLSDSAGILGRNSDIYGAAISSSNPSVLYIALYQNWRGEILKSIDAGSSFKNIYHLNGGGVPIVGISVYPNSANQVLIATAQGGLLRTNDGGKSWNAITWNAGAIAKMLANPALNAFKSGVNEINSDEIILWTRSGKIIRSADAGKTWIEVNPSGSKSLSNGFSYNGPRVDGVGENTDKNGELNVASGPTGFQFDLGRIFSSLNGTTNDLIISPSNAAVRYFKSGNLLYRSEDGGGSWKDVKTLLPPRSRLDAVAVNPQNPQEIFFAASGELHQSFDGGGTWEVRELPSNMMGKIQMFKVNPHDTEIIFAILN